MDSLLTKKRALEILDRFPGTPVLVIGDIMLDEYIWGKVSRISPEAPVPVVDVGRETFRLGGASNVAHNIADLKGEVFLCGVIGHDSMGRKMRSLLRGSNISTDALIEDRGRRTTVKSRIIAHSQQVVRYDREDRRKLDDDIKDRILEMAIDFLPRVRAVVISDYDKGVVDKILVKEIISAARSKGVLVAVDPKVSHFLWYKKASIVTPNEQEALAALGAAVEGSSPSIEDIGEKLRAMLHTEAILITRGEKGMSLFVGDGAGIHIPAVAREVYDVTGAGDTVVAVLAQAVVAGAELPEAAVIANYAAGQVVAGVGTTTINLKTLRGLMEKR